MVSTVFVMLLSMGVMAQSYTIKGKVTDSGGSPVPGATIRLEGTNVIEAGKILEESGMNFLVAHGLKDAAAKVTQALNK